MSTDSSFLPWSQGIPEGGPDTPSKATDASISRYGTKESNGSQSDLALPQGTPSAMHQATPPNFVRVYSKSMQPSSSLKYRRSRTVAKGEDMIVYCYVKIYFLTNVDTRYSNFECDFLIALDWYSDDLLEWQERFPNDAPDWFSEDGFFCPKVEIDNVHNKSDIVLVGGEAEPRLAGPKMPGWAKLTQRYRGALQAYFSVRDFPFDQHLLPISIKIRAGGSRAKCKLVHPHAEIRHGHHDIASNADFLPDWKVLKWFGVEDPDRSDMYMFSTHVQRHTAYIGWNIMFIFLLLEILMFTNYGVRKEMLGDRMSITLTLVLTAVAFKYVVKEELPNVPYLTILDKYILLGFAMMCFQGLENLYVSYLGNDLSDQVDNYAIAFTLFALIAKNLWVVFVYLAKTKRMTYRELTDRHNVEIVNEVKGGGYDVVGECIDRFSGIPKFQESKAVTPSRAKSSSYSGKHTFK